jgi:hypothetical protein
MVCFPIRAWLSTIAKQNDQTKKGKRKPSENGLDECGTISKPPAKFQKTKAVDGKGVGYSGNRIEDESGRKKAAEAQKLMDDRLKDLLQAVRVYLPNEFRAGGARPSDSMMHSSVLCHLRRRFNQIACSLLQSDSITDVHHREALFTELMTWFQVRGFSNSASRDRNLCKPLQLLSCHDGLASALAMVSAIRLSLTHRFDAL